MGSTPGTLAYNAIPTDKNNITTGLTKPPAEGCKLSQKIYLQGQKQDAVTSQFNGGTPSYEQFNVVTNFSSGKVGEDWLGYRLLLTQQKLSQHGGVYPTICYFLMNFNVRYVKANAATNEPMINTSPARS